MSARTTIHRRHRPRRICGERVHRHVAFLGATVLVLGGALGLGGVGALGVIGAPAAGASGTSGTTLYVSTTGTGTSPSAGCATGYSTIQAAVTAAASGDTIDVCAGTYREQVQIHTDTLSIVSATGPDAAVVEPDLDSTTTPFRFTVTDFPLGFPSFPVVPIVYVATHVTGITLQGLEVDADESEGQIGIFGIYYDTGSSGAIKDVTYTGDPTTAASGGSQNTGIFADYGTTVSITGSHVSGFYKSGIICAGNCDITGNTVKGVGPTPTMASPLSSGQNGIGMWEGATGTVSGNTVSDDDYILSPQQALGISVLESSTVTVSGNTLLDDNVAIAVDSFGIDSTAAKVHDVIVTDNTIDYNSTYTTFMTDAVKVNNEMGTQGIVVASYHGATPSSVAAVVEDNTVSGPTFDDSTVTPDVTDTGLQVGDMDAYPGAEFATVGGTLSVTAAGNTFSGWTADATVLGTLTGTANADLELNNFETASAFGVDNLSGTSTSVGSTETEPTKAVTADATSSWWGCTTGPSTPSCTAASTGVDTAPVLDSAVASATSSSDVATVTADGTTVTAVGNGVVNLGRYSGNPETSALASATGVYFDSNLSPGNTFSTVTVSACTLNGGDRLSWWDGAAWRAVTPQSFAAGCVTAPLTSSSSPRVTQLTGTVFGVAAPAPSAPAAPTTPPAPTPPAGATSHEACSVASGTLTCTNDEVTVTASSGPGALTVSQYSSDPETAPSFTSTGEYFDVQVASGSSFSTLTVKECELSGGTKLYWWDPTTKSWEAVVPVSGPTGTPPCLTATLSSTSTPTIAELTGTAFAVGTPAPAAPAATRVYGANADTTAADELTRTFPYTKGTCPASRAAVVATTKTYQDALSSQFLAQSLTTGTLLTPTESLSTVTAATLKDEGITTVYVVGGPLAITTTVVSAIEALTADACGAKTPSGKITVTRIYGTTQYGTAEAIATHVGTAASLAFPGAYATTNASGGNGKFNDTAGAGSTTAPAGAVPTAILASGLEFQDAQSASVVSYHTKLPLLLTPATTLSTTAVAAIAKLGIKQVVLIGGTLAITNTVEATLIAKTGVSVLRVAGGDYTDTAAELARFEAAAKTTGLAWTPGHRIMVARGNGFTDGIAGAVLDSSKSTATGPAGTTRPLLLTETPTTVGTFLSAFLKVTGHTGIGKTAAKTITSLTALGGPLALTTTVVTQMETDLSH